MSNVVQIAGFEDQIRSRAYALWENEGRPFGRDAEHWRASEEATRAELFAVRAPQKSAKPAPRRKPVKRATPDVQISASL